MSARAGMVCAIGGVVGLLAVVAALHGSRIAELERRLDTVNEQRDTALSDLPGALEARVRSLEGREAPDLSSLEARVRALEERAGATPPPQNSEPSPDAKRETAGPEEPGAAGPAYGVLLGAGVEPKRAADLSHRLEHWKAQLDLLRRQNDEERLRALRSAIQGHVISHLGASQIDFFASRFRDLWGSEDLVDRKAGTDPGLPQTQKPEDRPARVPVGRIGSQGVSERKP